MKLFLYLTGLIFLTYFQAISQELKTQESNQNLFDRQNSKYETSMERFYQSRSVIRTISPQVLEGVLDKENYLLGPGDLFLISVLGEIEFTYSAEVLPDGSVVIPTVGTVSVDGKKLGAAEEEIVTAIKKMYNRGEIKVALIGLRKFRIYLTGEVRNPGTYFAQGSDRLSDIIEISAGQNQTTREGLIVSSSGLNDWADNTRIQVRHHDGWSDEYDLSRFYKDGDISQNPFLMSGDMIIVPSINLDNDFVILEGNIGLQGLYPLRKNESIIGFLQRVSALKQSSNLEKIMVMRDNKSTQINFYDEVDEQNVFLLQNRDRIIIPTNYDRVYVRGEVASPGSYGYIANYKASDYIGIAGALETAGKSGKIKTIRQTTGEILEGGDIIVYKGDTIILNKRPREVTKEYMQILAPIISIVIATLALIK